MRLIKVETQGFKSFADKVVLTFDGGVVGVVGPNGSGKSNINDAIKWVLGEMSAKSLRGDSMEDVIFSGSKTVPALDKAYVSLTFDNREKRVSIPHEQFTITRSLKRGQTSEYFINGESARLRDIREIALESGMAKSSLAIISQGTVQDIAQASNEKRRLFFEQAAGIAKYKARKLEALRKLEKTTEALDKVRAVAQELERQLRPLKRQAEKARLYLAKRQELKSVEIALLAQDIAFYQSKLIELNAHLSGVETSRSDLQTRLQVSEEDLSYKTQRKLELDNEIHALETENQALLEKLEKVTVRDSLASQRRQLMIGGQIEAPREEQISALDEELNQIAQTIQNFQRLEAKHRETVEDRRRIIREIQADVYANQVQVDQNQTELLTLKSKVAILKDQRDHKSNLFKGVKTILQNRQIFSGLHGMVCDLIDVLPEHRTAIETVLQNALQHLVVDDSQDAIKAINFLKENRAGRASFVPLKVIKPKSIRSEHQQIASQQAGFVALGSSLVQADPKYANLVEYLLGHILVADTIESASELYRLFQTYPIVTLDGNIIRPGGSMTGGHQERSLNLLGLDQQIDHFESQVPSLEKDINKLRSEISLLQDRQQEEQSLIASNHLELAKLGEKISIQQSQYNLLKTQYETLTSRQFVAKEGSGQIEEDLIQLESQRASLLALIKAKRETAIALNHELGRLTTTKNDLERELRELLDKSSQQLNAKNQAEFILENARQRLAEEYEMTFEAALEVEKLTIEPEKAREIVKEIKGQLKELGPVNLDAIADYEEINGRFEKIKQNEEELSSAQELIMNAISQMDQVIITRLDETVSAVNREMDGIFKIMFGGGHAQVKYSDPSNLLETGIEVIAQPPGKTIRNLNLFSGGEKALIAISLLFAILKAQPLPLCILDEVEAALDEANVLRFADYLQELKDKTQFIVVTHRVGTMAKVDKLFGATMQKRGVTSFFSVALAQAANLVDKEEQVAYNG
ncbi:AAA family ATPase [Mycoplasma sp. ATU-Cv-703]|uniref:AAA family ATPase n=3 Tax=unclassified Mycoplasma TaxID=2683645 RepID=UPI000FDF2053